VHGGLSGASCESDGDAARNFGGANLLWSVSDHYAVVFRWSAALERKVSRFAFRMNDTSLSTHQ
jgi:hypothetical protein